MKNLLWCLAVLLTASSCVTYFSPPIETAKSRAGETSHHSSQLQELPEAAEPIVVAVYNFKDQTGQYKTVEAGSSFSTAVPQGLTSMLIKTLEDSKWFLPIERENLSNLLNERNIIRQTRTEYEPNSGNQLAPLLYAGVLIEGGIVSYDSNIRTGGYGARYFGVGGSTQYREDRITIYLRAVSTSTGRILKNVNVSKTILSQAIDASLFRYVAVERLMEAETGITKNEPVQLAVQDAIEKAVFSLIVEGLEDKLWRSKDGVETETVLINDYKEAKEEELKRGLYGRERMASTEDPQVSLRIGMPTLLDDITESSSSFSAGFSYHYKLNDYFTAVGDLNMTQLTATRVKRNYLQPRLGLNIQFSPYDKLAPYVYGGGSYMANLSSQLNGDSDVAKANALGFHYGAGLQYVINDDISVSIFMENTHTNADDIDGNVFGNINDRFYNMGIQIKYRLGKKRNYDALQ